MKKILKNKIYEAIASNSKKVLITLKKGELIEIKAITFLQILNFIIEGKSKDIEKIRSIKEGVNNLISDSVIIELDGEPPFYFLKEEFEKKIGLKDNIGGIEGFI